MNVGKTPPESGETWLTDDSRVDSKAHAPIELEGANLRLVVSWFATGRKWLGDRDSNPDRRLQRPLSYR